jgi:hypothetical protein
MGDLRRERDDIFIGFTTLFYVTMAIVLLRGVEDPEICNSLLAID